MPIDRQLDCYATLGIPPDAEEETIRAAYKALVVQYRPRRFPGAKEEARRRLLDVNTAYEVLTDPQRRHRYDFHRRIRERTDPLSNPPPANSFPSFTGTLRAASRLRQRRRRLAWIVLSVAVIFVSSVYWYSGSRAERRSQALAPPVAAAAGPAPVAAAAIQR